MVSHNDVSDFYSGGIGVLVPAGMLSKMPHDNLIEFNHLWLLGQGVTSDFGAIYVVGFDTTGNKVMNNWIHDVVHYPDLRANGGEGIYVDNVTSHVLVKNNLVYRVAHSTMFSNRGRENTWTNNIFAYGRNGGMLQRWHGRLRHAVVPSTPAAGIIYYTGPIQKGLPSMDQFFGDGPVPDPPRRPEQTAAQPGATPRVQRTQIPPGALLVQPVAGGTSPRIRGGELWGCEKNDDTPVPCTERFLLDNNLYWSPTGKPAIFFTTDVTNLAKPFNHSFAEWQALGEDVHSLNEDPRFVDAGYPADDFRLRPDSPASKIGFVPFDARQAGRTSTELKMPPIPHAFPVVVLDPIKDYHQPPSVASRK